MRELLALLALATSLGGASALLLTQEQQEDPPHEIVFTLDGEPIDALLDVPFEIKIGDETHIGTVSSKGTRYFNQAGLRFRYPADFYYEFDNEIEDCDVYVIEGLDTMIMVQVYNEELELGPTVNRTVRAVLKELAPFDVEVVKREISLGENTYESRQLRISIEEDGLLFTQDFFAFSYAQGTCVVCLQLDYDEAEILSVESAEAEDLLRSSFEYDAAK